MLKNELLKVERMVIDNNPEWPSELDRITSTYTSAEDTAAINDFIKEVMSNAKKTIDKVEKEYEDYTIKKKLGELDDAINFAYVARHYFGKSRSWLYQRIKGNTVNGKPAEFTDEEKERFHFALSDIGNKATCFQL